MEHFLTRKAIFARKFMSITAAAMLVLAACGCETAKGFARDVANTGNNIQDIVEGGPEFTE